MLIFEVLIYSGSKYLDSLRHTFNSSAKNRDSSAKNLNSVIIYSPSAGLQTATKTVAFATKNIHLRVMFLLMSPLATISIYML